MYFIKYLINKDDTSLLPLKKKKKKKSDSTNSKIPIPFKKIIINSYVLSKVSYFAPLLGSNKARTNNTQKLINKGLRWIAGIQKAKSYIKVQVQVQVQVQAQVQFQIYV